MALGAEPATVRPRLTVYDAMDDLASFRAAPPELRIREARLLSRGGPGVHRWTDAVPPAAGYAPVGALLPLRGRSGSLCIDDQGLAALRGWRTSGVRSWGTTG